MLKRSALLLYLFVLFQSVQAIARGPARAPAIEPIFRLAIDYMPKVDLAKAKGYQFSNQSVISAPLTPSSTPVWGIILTALAPLLLLYGVHLQKGRRVAVEQADRSNVYSLEQHRAKKSDSTDDDDMNKAS